MDPHIRLQNFRYYYTSVGLASAEPVLIFAYTNGNIAHYDKRPSTTKILKVGMMGLKNFN
jgi:hypothetical protein